MFLHCGWAARNIRTIDGYRVCLISIKVIRYEFEYRNDFSLVSIPCTLRALTCLWCSYTGEVHYYKDYVEYQSRIGLYDTYSCSWLHYQNEPTPNRSFIKDISKRRLVKFKKWWTYGYSYFNKLQNLSMHLSFLLLWKCRMNVLAEGTLRSHDFRPTNTRVESRSRSRLKKATARYKMCSQARLTIFIVLLTRKKGSPQNPRSVWWWVFAAGLDVNCHRGRFLVRSMHSHQRTSIVWMVGKHLCRKPVWKIKFSG